MTPIPEKRTVDDEVQRILFYMERVDPNSDEYIRAVQNLKVLCEARSKKPARSIEPDTLIAVVGNLIGILVILQHERFNVVTSRALALIRK